MPENKMKSEKKKCEYCKKTLVPIASKRKNGTYNQSDWDGRKYYKKCYKQLQQQKDFYYYSSFFK